MIPRDQAQGGKRRGVVLIGTVFLVVTLGVATYASTLSMQIASKGISNKEAIMQAQLGAEGAIEAGLRMLNESDTLDHINATSLGGTANDCDDPVASATPAINANPLTYGQYVVGAVTSSATTTAARYRVNYAVNMDLSASALLSTSDWRSERAVYGQGNNYGYPEPGNVNPNEFQGSNSGRAFMNKCYNATYLRLLRAEANVVLIGSETAANPIRRRVAAIVSIDPTCTNTPFAGYGGCKAEVLHWYEE